MPWNREWQSDPHWEVIAWSKWGVNGGRSMCLITFYCYHKEREGKRGRAGSEKECTLFSLLFFLRKALCWDQNWTENENNCGRERWGKVYLGMWVWGCSLVACPLTVDTHLDPHLNTWISCNHISCSQGCFCFVIFINAHMDTRKWIFMNIQKRTMQSSGSQPGAYRSSWTTAPTSMAYGWGWWEL